MELCYPSHVLNQSFCTVSVLLVTLLLTLSSVTGDSNCVSKSDKLTWQEAKKACEDSKYSLSKYDANDVGLFFPGHQCPQHELWIDFRVRMSDWVTFKGCSFIHNDSNTANLMSKNIEGLSNPVLVCMAFCGSHDILLSNNICQCNIDVVITGSACKSNTCKGSNYYCGNETKSDNYKSTCMCLYQRENIEIQNKIKNLNEKCVTAQLSANKSELIFRKESCSTQYKFICNGNNFRIQSKRSWIDGLRECDKQNTRMINLFDIKPLQRNVGKLPVDKFWISNFRVVDNVDSADATNAQTVCYAVKTQNNNQILVEKDCNQRLQGLCSNYNEEFTTTMSSATSNPYVITSGVSLDSGHVTGATGGHQCLPICKIAKKHDNEGDEGRSLLIIIIPCVIAFIAVLSLIIFLICMCCKRQKSEVHMYSPNEQDIDPSINNRKNRESFRKEYTGTVPHDVTDQTYNHLNEKEPEIHHTDYYVHTIQSGTSEQDERVLDDVLSHYDSVENPVIANSGLDEKTTHMYVSLSQIKANKNRSTHM